MPSLTSSTLARPIAMVLASIVSVQAGAAVAKGLFEVTSPDSMVWLRLATSTLVLVLLVRPRLRGRSRIDWWVVAGYGVCLGLMNWAIYHSFSRIPIGVAVTIEFIGPLAVAAFGSPRRRDLVWVGLAAVGVVLLGWERTSLDWVGVGFALLAGAGWAGYILLSSATGARWEGLDGLAVASTIAWILVTPLALSAGTSFLLDPRLLVLGAVIGLLSSLIPYSLELVALRSLPASLFGILMSIEPAAAALAALILLGEVLTGVQWLAMVLVMAASVGATHAASRRRPGGGGLGVGADSDHAESAPPPLL